jgi:hypothetical protein
MYDDAAWLARDVCGHRHLDVATSVPADLKERLMDVPPLTKRELVEGQERHRPFGTNLRAASGPQLCHRATTSCCLVASAQARRPDD